MKHALSTVEKLGLQFLYPFDTPEITFIPCLRSDFAAHLLHRKSSNLGNIYQPQDELGNIPLGRDDDGLASWQCLPQPSSAMCNQPYCGWVNTRSGTRVLVNRDSALISSRCDLIYWWGQESAFQGQHRKVWGSHGSTSVQQGRDHNATAMLQWQFSVATGQHQDEKWLWEQHFVVFRSSPLGVTLWFILTL